MNTHFWLLFRPSFSFRNQETYTPTAHNPSRRDTVRQVSGDKMKCTLEMESGKWEILKEIWLKSLKTWDRTECFAKVTKTLIKQARKYFFPWKRENTHFFKKYVKSWKLMKIHDFRIQETEVVEAKWNVEPQWE